MNYLIGLRNSGHDVVYLEDCGMESWVYRCETDNMTTELDYPASYVQDCLKPLGLGGEWIYRAGDRSEGMALDRFLEVCSKASLFIVHSNPINPWRPEYSWPKRRIFIDGDPGFTQIMLIQGKPDLTDTIDRCERLFTVGQLLTKPGSQIPSAGRRWFPTVHPVSLRDWHFAENGPATHFTSLMHWRGFHDLTHNGITYGQKDREFPRFIELPRFTTQPFLMGLTGASPEWMANHGWEVVSGVLVSRTPSSYQRFIQTSRAEFGVAKQGYVQTRGGWFSDRSACYLASGRPVLLQDTGQKEWVPVGEGILTFQDPPQALEGIRAINLDYERHRRAARLLAEEYFDVDRVLPPLLENAMN